MLFAFLVKASTSSLWWEGLPWRIWRSYCWCSFPKEIMICLLSGSAYLSEMMTIMVLMIMLFIKMITIGPQALVRAELPVYRLSLHWGQGGQPCFSPLIPLSMYLYYHWHFFIPQPWLKNYPSSLCSSVQKQSSQSSVCEVHLDIVQSGLWL